MPHTAFSIQHVSLNTLSLNHYSLTRAKQSMW